MNSKSLQYNNDIDSSLQTATSPQRGVIEAIVSEVAAWLTPGHSEQSQAGYRARRARAVQADMNQDIVRSLPTVE